MCRERELTTVSKAGTNTPRFRFLTTTFAFPALFVFLVPVVSYLFFRHAQGQFDDRFRNAVLRDIRTNQRITADERTQAIAFFSQVPLSRILANDELLINVPADTRFHYATFRWMILISEASITAGVGVFLLAGVCVALSLYSQFVQYISLSAGWHVLRIYGALQAIAQGILLVALSYWVTALWFDSYWPQLILVVGVLAAVAVGYVISAIFRRIKNDFAVSGRVLGKDEATALWDELNRICARVGTAPPDQIVAGIDDNFFVTERPLTVGDRTYRGRTLFVSLSLLKQLQGGEANAVLAHEMAHFSGGDTLYSRKISPLLMRYGEYLRALHEGGLTLPIYYYMLCFRVLFELSLGRRSRQREFRSDRIALETTSARDAAGALLRTAAYSHYRNDVVQDLFKKERVLETANVCERIELGFRQYAAGFVAGPNIGELAPAHPFDTHPPLAERLRAIGVPMESEDLQTLLAAAGDGRWYQFIPTAEQMEKEQWQEYEEEFRQYHERSLPFRFLPETAEEREIVVKAFPAVNFTGKRGVLALDYEKMEYGEWPEPIRYSEITRMALDDKSVLEVDYGDRGQYVQYVKMSTFANRQVVLNAIQHYYGRYQSAAAYQNQKKEGPESSDSGDRDR
jgi:Zn-dependent protease with chaperone function